MFCTASGLSVELSRGAGPDRPIDTEMLRVSGTADDVFREMQVKVVTPYPTFSGLVFGDRGVYVASVAWVDAGDWTRKRWRSDATIKRRGPATPWPLPGCHGAWVVTCAGSPIVQATVDRSDWLEHGSSTVAVCAELTDAIARVDRLWGTFQDQTTI